MDIFELLSRALATRESTNNLIKTLDGVIEAVPEGCDPEDPVVVLATTLKQLATLIADFTTACVEMNDEIERLRK